MNDKHHYHRMEVEVHHKMLDLFPLAMVVMMLKVMTPPIMYCAPYHHTCILCVCVQMTSIYIWVEQVEASIVEASPAELRAWYAFNFAIEPFWVTGMITHLQTILIYQTIMILKPLLPLMVLCMNE
jgi:hypothetical protein